MELAADGTTVLLTTQYLEETEQLAQTVVVVDRGKVVASGTPDELKRTAGGERVDITINARADRAAAAAALSGVGRTDLQVDDSTHTVSAAVPAGAGAKALVDIIRRLDDNGIPIEDITLRRPSLEDAFLALTDRRGLDGQAAVAAPAAAAPPAAADAAPHAELVKGSRL
jgi:ABC-2 type transport system ATP-binding protein